MNTSFLDPVHPGERESLANAFTEIAKGGLLPVPTLEILATAFEAESNRHIRIAILFALAHMAADYPPAVDVITAATSDLDSDIVRTADSDIVRTAEHGLRIVEANRVFADTDPLTLATDKAAPVNERLQGLRVISGSTIDPEAFEPIASLVQDPEIEIAVAALEIIYRLARDPGDDFDRRVLIPALSGAMSNPDPLIRYAAYGALSTISIHRRDYLHAADFPAQLDTGANDPDPKIRVVVLLAMLRAAGGMLQRDLIIERGMTDPDPYVRRMAAGWLGSPRVQTSRRQEFIAQALDDPDPAVRASAAAANKDWGSRKRSWAVTLWQDWQAGERKKVGMTILIAVTVATPILICGIFLLYYLARLLAYLLQRRWRVVAVVVVLSAWVTASYGMIMLYFMAAHIGDADTSEIAIVAAALWGAIGAYTALGWGMHYAVRR